MPKNKSKKQAKHRKELLSPCNTINALKKHKSGATLYVHHKLQADEKPNNFSCKGRKITFPLQDMMKEQQRVKSFAKESKSVKNISISRSPNRRNLSAVNFIKSFQTLKSTDPSQELNINFSNQMKSCRILRRKQDEILMRFKSVLGGYEKELEKQRKEKEYLKRENLKLREWLKYDSPIMANDYQI